MKANCKERARIIMRQAEQIESLKAEVKTLREKLARWGRPSNAKRMERRNGFGFIEMEL